MRFEDWDVLIFPRDCKIPLQEFQVACHVVPDKDVSHTHGVGLPTVCCFVPSLLAGTPCQVSLHSWAGFPQRLAESQTEASLKFEARLFFDGRIVSFCSIDQNSSWPQLLTHHNYGTYDPGDSSSRTLSQCTELTGHGEPLIFPSFRREVLEQGYWSPADDLGKLKIVISEVLVQLAPLPKTERVRNIVAFSFQHAPLTLLQTLSIAWPNPYMWRCAPIPVSSYESRELGQTLDRTHRIRPMENESAMSGVALSNVQEVSQKVHTAEHQGREADTAQLYSACRDQDMANQVCTADSYVEWLSGIAALGGTFSKSNTMPAQNDLRVAKKTRTSMPDSSATYESCGGEPPDACFTPFVVRPDEIGGNMEETMACHKLNAGASLMQQSKGSVRAQNVRLTLARASPHRRNDQQGHLQDAIAKSALSATSDNPLEKGVKRARDGASKYLYAKVSDEENEQRRGSSRFSDAPSYESGNDPV